MKYLSRSMILLATMFIAGAAGASGTPMNVSGNFYAAEGSEQQYVSYLDGEAINVRGSSMFMYASVARVPHSYDYQSVYVDGSLSHATDVTSCLVIVKDWNGNVLSTKGGTATGHVGYWDWYVAFDTNEAPFWAYMTVQCEVPDGCSMLGVQLN